MLENQVSVEMECVERYPFNLKALNKNYTQNVECEEWRDTTKVNQPLILWELEKRFGVYTKSTESSKLSTKKYLDYQIFTSHAFFFQDIISFTSITSM